MLVYVDDDAGKTVGHWVGGGGEDIQDVLELLAS